MLNDVRLEGCWRPDCSRPTRFVSTVRGTRSCKILCTLSTLKGPARAYSARMMSVAIFTTLNCSSLMSDPAQMGKFWESTIPTQIEV